MTWRPAAAPPPPVPPSDLQLMFAEIVRRHLAEGDWGIVAVQPLRTLPAHLQADLGRTFSVHPEALVVVFEPRGQPEAP